MIRDYKIKLALLILLTASAPATRSQTGITGDTIYVSSLDEVAIRFPKPPSVYYTTPKNAPYNLKSLTAGLTIIAKYENTAPASLIVEEGGRNHTFKVVFKKNISDAEVDYDYTTVQKINQRIQQIAAAKDGNTKTVPQIELSQDKKPDEAVITGFENAPEYQAITTTGQRLYDNGKYKESRTAFTKALALRPGDLYATRQIEKIDAILLKDDVIKAQAKNNELYKNYMDAAGKAFALGNWADARLNYEIALSTKPEDSNAKNQLLIIDQKEKQQKEKEEKATEYTALMKQADELEKAESWDEAREMYAKAAKVGTSNLPTQKIKDINERQKQQLIKEKEAADRQKTESLERENREKEKQYEAFIKQADGFFVAEDYKNANEAYQNAYRLFQRPWPSDQMKEIAKLTTQLAIKQKKEEQARIEQLSKEKKEAEIREKEEAYRIAVKNADDLFVAGDFEQSKKKYIEALGYYSTRPWPREQLAAIDKKMAEQVAAEYAERKRAEQEKIRQDKYDKLFANAEQFFAKEDYVKAKKIYKDASLLKPDESLPQQRIDAITAIEEQQKMEQQARRDSIALVKETQNKYNFAIAKAKSYLQKEDLQKAKEAYQEAIELKPIENEPKVQLEIIEKKLAEMARLEAIEQAYDASIDVADSLYISRKYDEAIDAYNNALTIKQGEYYPQQQIKNLKSELERLRIKAEKAAREQAKKEREERYWTARNNGDAALRNKDYATAIVNFTISGEMRPDDGYSADKLRIAKYQESINKPKVEEVVEDKNTKKKKKKN